MKGRTAKVKKKGWIQMVEKVYGFNSIEDANERLIEKVIDDEEVLVNHMILPKDTGLPEHYANSNVYMVIIRGYMTIGLNDNPLAVYSRGKILNIPYNTKMKINNLSDEVLEFFVFKVPNPRNYLS